MRRSKHAYRSCFLSMPSFSMSKDFTSSICNAPCSAMVQRQQWPCFGNQCAPAKAHQPHPMRYQYVQHHYSITTSLTVAVSSNV